MRGRTQPLDWVGGPERYASPDWSAIGTVARVWVPDAETVGWAVLQGDDRLAWLPASPGELGGPIRLLVEGLVQAGAAEGVSALDTWNEILRVTLHTTPEDLYLPAAIADLGSAVTASSTAGSR